MRRALFSLAAALVLAGCSSLNPFNWFGGGAVGPQPAPLPVLANPLAVKALWSSSIGSAATFIFSPAVAQDSVYVASRDGSVARIDAATGRAVWRVKLDAHLSAGVGSDGRLAVVATDGGEVFALDAANGKQRWRARVSSEVLAAPQLGAGLVLVRSDDSRIFAFDEQTGERRWYYQRAAPSLLVRSPAGMTISGGLVYAGFSGKLVALDLASGNVRWEATVALPRGATELERVTDIVGNPAVSGAEVCAAAYQGRVACFDATSGSQLWSREMSTVTGVSVDGRDAFVSDDKGAVYAFELASGRSLWKQDKLANRQLSLPLPLGSEIAVGDLQGYVHFLARESGAFVARVATDGSPIRAAPVRLPGRGFLVQTQGGGLYALSL
ncbi:MAG: outer membrane protein assembly factor BamB [Betaproteobacteria bacterium]|nr:outer membrane protein assembly factor BamB [Betaproteobacteria bacterium]